MSNQINGPEPLTPELFELLMDPGDPVDIHSLAESTYKSFELIQPWCVGNLSSMNTLEMEATAQGIILQAKEYMLAIALSIETAKNGYALACEAGFFCSTIADMTSPRSSSESQDTPARKYTVQDLESFLESMLSIAEEAHKLSSAATQQFQEVRVGLFNLLKDISPRSICSDEDITQNNIEEGSSAVRMIAQAREDIIQLSLSVRSFVGWWSNMKMTLGALHAAIPRIKLDGSNPLRTTYVLKRWSDMRLQYEQYDTKIHYARLSFPQVSLEDVSVQAKGRAKLIPNYSALSGEISQRGDGTPAPPTPIQRPLAPSSAEAAKQGKNIEYHQGIEGGRPRKWQARAPQSSPDAYTERAGKVSWWKKRGERKNIKERDILKKDDGQRTPIQCCIM